MGNQGIDGGLSPLLSSNIERLNPLCPWVWQLHLTEADFIQLESALAASIQEHGGSHDHLISPKWAKTLIVYIAEWYKRRYEGVQGQDLLNLNNFEFSRIWEYAGINKQTFLYTDSQGHQRWQYSTYILGGLAIRHESKRGDGGRFLRALCRMFHRESSDIEKLDDAARAVSFRESISREHSLYYFLTGIISYSSTNGANEECLPFDRKEMNDSSSEVYAFIELVKRANDEVLREKFRLEWIITNAPGTTRMARALRLWMRPEEGHEGRHNYMLYPRLHLWGIHHPEDIRTLHLSLKYLNGDTVVKEPDFDHSDVLFINTGEVETGFVSLGIKQCIVVRDIPTCRFDGIEILLQDDQGNIYHTQKRSKIEQYMQLWRTEPWGTQWSDQTSNQHATALLFSPEWQLVEDAELFDRKPFGAKTCESEAWGFVMINDSVTIQSKEENGQTHTFWNRQGYDRIFTRLYTNVIKYVDGSLVKYCEEDEDGIVEPDYLPAVFSHEDILIRHFNSKDDCLNLEPEDEVAPDQIEWKDGRGYTLWTETNQPHYGLCKLRLTHKGVEMPPYNVVFLPRIAAGAPMERDFDSMSVKYCDYGSDNKVQPRCMKDNILRNNIPLQEAISLTIGPEEGYSEIDVYRPTQQKELCANGHVLKYIDTDDIKMPYILKQDLLLRDFSKNGFRSYSFSNLGSIYPFLSNDEHLELWRTNKNNRHIMATELDALAPDNVEVVFGESNTDNAEGLSFYLWNFITDPQPVASGTKPEKNSVVFQSLEHIDDQLRNVAPERNFFAFGWKAVARQISLVHCFDVAVKHKLHFFMLEPFRQMKGEDFKVFFDALFSERGGALRELDKMALTRMADEFRFSWGSIGVNIEK